jgi:hypothetical protein
MQRTDFKFYIQREDAVSATEMFPLNTDKVSYVYKNNETWAFFRKEFKGDLIFIKADYNYFKNEYDTTNACYKYQIYIEKFCDDKYSVDWIGYFSLNDGKFDFDKCTYGVEPNPEDIYTNILKNLDTKINFITNSISKHTISYEHAVYSLQHYQQCRKLFDVILYITNTFAGINVLSSDFFQNATNPVTVDTNKLTKLYISGKSDIKYNTASNPARKCEVTLNEMFKMLYNLFQVKWDIQEIGGVDTLVLKHVSEINKAAGLDITVFPYSETTAHKRIFEWGRDKLYRYEKWVWRENNGEDFVGLPIEYNEYCTRKDSQSSLEYNMGNLTTDIDFITTCKYESEQDKIANEGYVLFVTDDSDILAENGALSGISQFNGHLSIANLHANYWKHDRILESGKLNGILINFLSYRKMKVLKDLKIILCCDVDFDPNDTITTDLGEGYLDNAELSLFDYVLKMVINI